MLTVYNLPFLYIPNYMFLISSLNMTRSLPPLSYTCMKWSQYTSAHLAWDFTINKTLLFHKAPEKTGGSETLTLRRFALCGLLSHWLWKHVWWSEQRSLTRVFVSFTYCKSGDKKFCEKTLSFCNFCFILFSVWLWQHLSISQHPKKCW